MIKTSLQATLLTCSLLTVLLLFNSCLVSAMDGIDNAGVARIHGALQFWMRTSCSSANGCSLPAATSTQLPVSIEFQVPTEVGSHLVYSQSFPSELSKSVSASANKVVTTPYHFTAEIMMIWVNPPIGSNSASPPVPYLVTQLRLKETALGILAECSRYDGVATTKFLMPGSCSARLGDAMFGLSTLSQ
jgi:hypothetical protein